MAETHTKRRREDAGDSETETTKRHRNSHINEQQQETNQDFSDFFTNISFDPFIAFTQQPEPDPENKPTTNPSVKEGLVDDDDDEKERVIRHLLEASDDELGIPSMADRTGDGGVDVAGDDEIAVGEYEDLSFALCDGLWELEDETANYYTLLQSELFMQ